MVGMILEDCPSCGRGTETPEAVCPACGRVVALWSAMPALRAVLERGGDEATMLAVVDALARIGGPAVAAEVREWLLPRIPVAINPGQMVELLGTLPDATARAEATRIARENFADTKLAGRWEQVLARLETRDAREALVAGLAHEDETVRWTAIHAMLEEWETVPGEAALLLRRLLRSPEETGEVQFCAAALLARMEDPELGPECAVWLAEALADAEGTVADSLAEPTMTAAALLRVSDPEAAETARRFLLRRLESGSVAILNLALPPLLASPSPELVEALVAGCLSRKPRSPSAAAFARAFRELREPSLRVYAWERLRHLLGDGEEPRVEGVSLTLLQALGHLGWLDARPLVAAIARQPQDPLVLETVCETLARLGDPDAIDACASQVLAAANGEDATAADRRAAAMAEVLGEIADAWGRARAVTPLAEALDRPSLSRHAASALAALAGWDPAPGTGGMVEPSEPEPAVVEAPESTIPAPPMLIWIPDPEEDAEAPMLVWMPDPEEEPEAPVPLAQVVSGGEKDLFLLPPALPTGVRALDGQDTDGAVATAALPAAAANPKMMAATVVDLEREVARLPAGFFRYAPMEAAEVADKERQVMGLLCEEMQPALDRLAVMGEGSEWQAWMSRAYYVKARLHHAMTCDLKAREGGGTAERSEVVMLRQRQRWDQMKQAERAYEQAVKLAQDDVMRVRALFDEGVLMAETERADTAAMTFERIVALGGNAPQVVAAARYLERLREPILPEEDLEGPAADTDDCLGGALWVARRALRGALWSSAGLAACGAVAWYAWTAMPRPANATVALRPTVIARLEVTRSTAKVRTDRAYRARKVKTARRGERLHAIGRSERWWKVQFANGVTGWIPRRYTRVTSDE